MNENSFLDCKESNSIGDILIIDDDENISLLLRNTFEKIGCNVDISFTIEQAEEMLKNKAYKIALLDLKFPGDIEELSGLLYLQSLKKNYPNMGIIVVSGNSKKPVLIDVLNSGADGFVLKPFKIDDLMERIKEVYGKIKIADFESVLTAASYRISRAYELTKKNLDDASIEAKKIIERENANGVIISAYLGEGVEGGGI